MRVKDLMQTDVVTLDAADSLDLANDVMQLGRIRHMPVVTKGRLVGILSQRDLFRAACSSVLHFRPAAEREWLAKISLHEVMTRPVFTVGPRRWSRRRSRSWSTSASAACRSSRVTR